MVGKSGKKLFIGRTASFLDSKNRLYIPGQLKEDHFKNAGEAVLALGLDRCLYLLPEEMWRDLYNNLKSHPVLTPQGAGLRGLVRYLMSNSSYRRFDSKNRIIIPEEHKKYAGLGREAVLVGAGNRLEIWAAEKYSAFEKLQEKKYKKLAGQVLI